MIVAYLFAGFGLGISAGGAMLVAGYSWWMALLGYAATGALTLFAGAVVLSLIPSEPAWKRQTRLQAGSSSPEPLPEI